MVTITLGEQMLQTILHEERDSIATITFNRPAAMNALNRLMAEELAAVTEQILNNDSIRAVLIKGAGKLFMAGGDLHFFYETLEAMPQDVLTIVRTVNASLINLTQMAKPVVACVHGSVAGIGLSYMLAADLVIAAEDTKFTTAYSKIALTPDGGLSYTLPHLIGMKKAMELLLLSEVFSASEALNLGLVNRLASTTKVFAEAEKLVRALAQGPTKSYARIKQLVHNSTHSSLVEQLEAEVHAFAAAAMTEDFKRGVTAFVKKIRPEFSGD